MCTVADFFNLMKTIHAMDDLSPEKLTSVLNAVIHEVAEARDDHPRRLFIGAPKTKQPDTTWIKTFELNIPRMSHSLADRFMVFQLAPTETIKYESIRNHFGPPTDMRPNHPPLTEVDCIYINGSKTICFKLEKWKLQCVIITKKGPKSSP